MNIDGSGPINNQRLFDKVQDSDKDKSVGKKDGSRETEGEKDKVSLSGQSKVIGDLKSLIDGVPDIRRDKIDALQKAIDAGSYNFDSKKIAERLLAEEM